MGRSRSDIEKDKDKSKDNFRKGAKALGRAEILNLILEVSLDIRDLLTEVKDKLN